jgi:hypothetical protein
MNGKSLVRRVLRNDQLRRRYHSPAWTPAFARCVLEQVASLAAQSDEAGVWRLDLTAEGVSTRGQFLAEAFQFHGFEAEIDSHLAALARAGLLIEEDGALALPLPVAAAGGRAEAGRKNGAAGGRPRAGETPEMARARRRAEQSAAEGQRNLVMAMPKPERGEETGPPTIQRTGETGAETGQETGEISRQVPPTGSQTGHDRFSGASRREEGIVGGDEEIIDKSITAAPPTPPDSGSARPAGAPGETGEKPNRKPDEKPDVRFSETGPPTISRAGAAHIHAFVGATPEPLISIEAVGLAKLAGRGRGWASRHADEAPGIIQGYLDRGFTSAQVRETIEGSRGAKLSSAKGLAALLEAQYVEQLRGPPVVGATVPARPLDPRIQANPVYCAAPAELHRSIVIILDTLERPEGFERRNALSAQRKYRRQAYDLVRSQVPDLDDLADPEALGALRRQAAN